MDLRSPTIQPPHALQPFQPIQISTVAADHNLVIAGGFYGEYGMTRLDAPPGSRHIEGLMTHDPNPITNHIQIYLNRHSGLPQAAFASNDNGLRILDCMTNTIAAQHKFDYAINCSAISPDHRLRALVGDTRSVMISNAETGETLQELSGHEDYGFACAWADNGWHVATGNQDKLIKVWDARMWTDHHGAGKPLKTIAATMAGARSLKFSPLGSGKRVLVASEAADIISVIDAETYNEKQTLDLYGEICGVDFTPDGSLLFAGINDPLRGGIMEFEKCGFGDLYGFKEKEVSSESSEHKYVHTMQQDVDEKFTGLDWRKTDSEVVSHPRSKLTATHLQRRAARSRDMEPF
jgi:WD40 repeat protein